ncbi:Pkinase domain-containing protein/U-box domain-containing protein [Cephalotus follicularis]|uniref:RING-type E3 ubiquitin transferase n=1 Tax=Cephalotus follicularis TaxID=3775 RepID=A0A1Q3AQT3_CEPFO|nr:Pkinase domain-containing protein/U-box domain-containing protein [Cephalotus follicularis]
MELLSPSPPPHHDRTRDRIPGFPPSGYSLDCCAVMGSQLPEIVEESSSSNSGNGNGDDKVFVAVGKSVDKALSLLQWSFRTFEGRKFVLLHVHRPSPFIPTLLGKLPASQANGEVVSAYRRQEREQTRKLLESYLRICSTRKVKASVVTTEADQVQKGILELVNRHCIRNLVMGAVSANCMKVRRRSSKANYAAKNAPSFCEIWIISKGKHMWTKEASEGRSASPPYRHADGETAKISRVSNWVIGETVEMEVALSPSISSSNGRLVPYYLQTSFSPTSTSTGTEYTSERGVSSDSDSRFEENSHNQLIEARIEAETSKNKAFAELLKSRQMEVEAVKAISKVKFFEAALAYEVEFRKEAEDALRNMIEEKEKILEERGEVTRELQKAMRNVALLDSRVQEANRKRDEASEELKLIQASLANLRQEKQKLRQQKMEAVRWLDRWRGRGQAGATKCSGFIGVVEAFPELAEFTLSDLQTATCNFSESFKLGQGGYGRVYKGEMLGRTVAIKKLHPHNMQGQSEFQKEVQVLGKLQHPHLVTLLGACPEACSLVYEYLPNGSLKDRLFPKNNISPLAWKIRVQMIAEISSALCFLHSSKPETIVHGDLKPENILLDSELHCRICEFGICRLATEDSLRCPSFRRSTEPKGAFPYTDPEFCRIGVQTPKSDIYSFGVIILQLLTGRPPVGLVGEVRKAMSCGKSVSILDSLAGEWPTFVARRLLDLGLQCCELNGRDRPDLTPTLVRELEQIHVPEERPVPSYFLCPILQEIMHDPQVAADGFTYEGEALLGWFANGRETSPMTNLKFDHLNLTPNRALRLSIQDWLCKQ